MEMPDLSDEMLVQIYQEALDEIDVDDLEHIARHWDDKFANNLREHIGELLVAVHDKHGISAKDFGKLIVLNGISAIAAQNYRERSN